MIRMAVLLLAVMVAACAATGVQITEEQLSFLEPGKTTINDAVAKLGSPNLMMRNPDGTRTISYVYSEAQARPETFIPIVGAFVGGADVRSNVVMLQFDGAGRFISHTAAVSAFGTGTNLSSGAAPGRVEGQPKQTR